MMNIFKDLLQESQSSALVEKLKGIYDGYKRAEAVKTSIVSLETAVANKKIYNVEYNELKDVFSRALESVLRDALDKITHSSADDSPHMLVYQADVSYYVSLNQCKSQVKKIKGLLTNKSLDGEKVHLEAALAANEAGMELYDILTKLKPLVIKGRRPAEVDPNSFRSKLGSAESQKLVKDALEAGVKAPMDDYEKAVEEWLQRYVDNINKSNVYSQPTDRRLRDGLADMIFQHCFSSDKDYDATTKDDVVYKNVKIRADRKDFATTDAAAQRKNIEQKYLVKNIKKLSHVVDLKGNLSKIETLEYRKPKINSGSGTLESGFKFIFADGSEFTVINKIVTKYSYSGTRFEQFPTTFHDVKLADGTKMKTPSEEKMVKEFGSSKHEA